MTVGSPTQGKDGMTKHKGLRFTCLDTKSTRFPEIDDFPKQKCRGGIMTEHHFPGEIQTSLLIGESIKC